MSRLFDVDNASCRKGFRIDKIDGGSGKYSLRVKTKKKPTVKIKIFLGAHFPWPSLRHKNNMNAMKINTVYTDHTHGCTAAKSSGIVEIMK